MPASTSICLTHSSSVCGTQPIFGAIDSIAAHSDGYLLLESQSSADAWMALRVMVYVGLLYQDLIKTGEASSPGRLPAVFPIVIYNGDPAWAARRDVAVWIRRVIVRRLPPQAKLPPVNELSWVQAMLSRNAWPQWLWLQFETR